MRRQWWRRHWPQLALLASWAPLFGVPAIRTFMVAEYCAVARVSDSLGKDWSLDGIGPLHTGDVKMQVAAIEAGDGQAMRVASVKSRFESHGFNIARAMRSMERSDVATAIATSEQRL